MAIKIGVLSIVKNEEYILPFFFRNYDPWVDEYIIYDNESTDRTAEILKRHPRVRYEVLQTGGLTVDSGMMAVKNGACKHTEFDWIAAVDADELITGQPNIREAIEKADTAGADCVLSRTIDLASLSRPVDDGISLLQDLIPDGVLSPPRLNDGKGIFFKTGIPMHFSPGQHRFNATRKVCSLRNTMFHTRFLSWSHIVERCHKFKLCDENVANDWGVRQRSEKYMVNEWLFVTMNARPWREITEAKEITDWKI